MMMAKLEIALIAAIGANRELGKDNKLLWHIPEDLKRFKKLTLGHPVIMGRKTFESIGHPLPDRTNIVVTRKKNYTAKGCVVSHSIKEALKAASRTIRNGSSGIAKTQEIFIIGGARIYQQSIGFADRLYLTLVHASAPAADVFFPDYSAFTRIIDRQAGSCGDYTYTFLTLER